MNYPLDDNGDTILTIGTTKKGVMVSVEKWKDVEGELVLKKRMKKTLSHEEKESFAKYLETIANLIRK